MSQAPNPGLTGRTTQLLVASIVMLVTVSAFLPAAAAEISDPTGDAAQQLAGRYSPIFMLREQSADCDTEGEPFAPMPVDVILDNPDVLLRQAGEADPIVTRAPSAGDLYERGPGFFLDFNGLALQADCVYEFDYDRYTRGRPSAVYAHIVTQDDRPGFLAIQYWSYWYFNDWNNKHESDWEFIQVLFEADTIAEALSNEPVSVGYAQHEGGERAEWGSDKLTQSDTHPIVYASAGSHASYFASTYYLGRKGTEGFGCDTTEGPSVEAIPEVILLPDSVDDPNSPLAWLGFTGRWGERHTGPFNGPTGPTSKERWSRPIDWAEGLRSASVALPVAELGNGSTITKFCRVVDFSSNQYRAAKVSPYRLVALAGAILLLIRLLIALTDWDRIAPTPLARRRRLGQLLRGATASALRSGGTTFGISLAYLPVAIAIGLVGWIWSLRAAQALGGIVGPVLYVGAIMGTSLFWDQATEDSRPSIRSVYHQVRNRLLPTVWTVIMAAGIVGLLALTIVGIPLAIRQLVRYQFVTPVATLEGVSGSAALKRSSELVEGRWWYTAVVTGVLNALLVYSNLALSLALLVVFAGIPLWVFLGISFAAWGLFVPTVATAPVLLYGDAVAEEQGHEYEEIVKPSFLRRSGGLTRI